MICGHLWRSLISDAQVLYAANKRLVISSPLLNCFHTYFKELTAMGKLDSIHGPHPESTHTMPHPASPGIVTYRLRERMVYVTPAETYDVSHSCLAFCYLCLMLFHSTASNRLCEDCLCGRALWRRPRTNILFCLRRCPRWHTYR